MWISCAWASKPRPSFPSCWAPSRARYRPWTRQPDPPRFCTYRTLTMLCCSTDGEKPRKGTRGGGQRLTPRLLRKRAAIARRRPALGARLSRGIRRGRSWILERLLSGFSIVLTPLSCARAIVRAHCAPQSQASTESSSRRSVANRAQEGP